LTSQQSHMGVERGLPGGVGVSFRWAVGWLGGGRRYTRGTSEDLANHVESFTVLFPLFRSLDLSVLVDLFLVSALFY